MKLSGMTQSANKQSKIKPSTIKPPTIKQWWLLPVALVLVACGAKYMPPLWGVTADIFGEHYHAMPATARVLADGSVRRAYQRDSKTLVSEIYNAAGERVTSREFSHNADYGILVAGYPQKPLFLSDNEFYWVGPEYSQSVHVDIEKGSVTPLPPISMNTEGAQFGIHDAILLEDGALLLAGTEKTGFMQTTGRARLVVVKEGAVTQSLLLPTYAMFSTALPVKGTNQAFLQAQLRLSDNQTAFQLYYYDGNTLIEQPDIGSDTPLFADENGLWTYRYDYPNSRLRYFDTSQHLAWELPAQSATLVSPTSDGSYLVKAYIDEQQLLIKMNLLGDVLWQTKATSNTYMSTAVERNGRVVAGEIYTHWLDTTRPNPADTSKVQDVSLQKENVRYRVLDSATGVDIVRFAEPEYYAMIERVPLTSTLLGILEFTPGSCRLNDVLLQDDGSFYALTQWCSDDLFYSSQQHLSFFRQ